MSGFTRCTLSGYSCVTKPKLQALFDLNSAEIEEIQKLINRLVKNDNLAVDGKLGSETPRALEDWPRANGQTIDGGPTRQNLEKPRQAA
jgi:peptidoglycan hydrolase-like protein with peptidoglycan-binding domain